VEPHVVTRALAALAILGACSYDPSFIDCSIPCETSADCPSDFSCGDEKLCRPAGATGPSCLELACENGPVNVLENGNFDASGLPWIEDPPNILCGPPTITPASGMYAACLGGGGDNSSSAISRNIRLPPSAASAHLDGRICIATQETQGPDHDVLAFEIVDGPTTIGALGQRANQQGAATCGFSSFSLDASLSGPPPTATFRIRSMLDVGEATTFYVDSLVLTVMCR
jgi:hypothetical protein